MNSGSGGISLSKSTIVKMSIPAQFTYLYAPSTPSGSTWFMFGSIGYDAESVSAQKVCDYYIAGAKISNRNDVTQSTETFFVFGIRVV